MSQLRLELLQKTCWYSRVMDMENLGILFKTLVVTDQSFVRVDEIRWFDNILQNDEKYWRVKKLCHQNLKARLAVLKIGIDWIMVSPKVYFYAIDADDHRCKVDADTLAPGMYVYMSVPADIRDIEDISEEDCMMVGYLLRFGGFVPPMNKNDKVMIPTSKKFAVNHVTAYLRHKQVDFTTELSGKMTTISWKKSDLLWALPPGSLRTQQCRRLPTAMMKLPIHKTQALINGVLCDDEVFVLDGPQLSYCVQYLLYRTKRPAKVGFKNHCWKVELWDCKDYKVLDDKLYLKVKDVSVEEWTTELYSICSMEEDHRSEYVLNTPCGQIVIPSTYSESFSIKKGECES